MLLLSSSFPGAESTVSCSRWSRVVVVGIRFVVGMTSRAMSLARIFGCSGLSTEKVDLTGHRLQMFRIDAKPVATCVIELHPVRDWADKQFIDDTVDSTLSALEVNSSVAMLRGGAQPQPARLSSSDSIPQAHFQWGIPTELHARYYLVFQNMYTAGNGR
jgi:hypothetical protein